MALQPELRRCRRCDRTKLPKAAAAKTMQVADGRAHSIRSSAFRPSKYMQRQVAAIALLGTDLETKIPACIQGTHRPVTITGFGLNAAIYQAAGYPSYQQGANGYGQCLGATFVGGYSKIMIGDAILPSLLYQDPRYFYQGTGNTKSSLLHAYQVCLSPAAMTAGVRSTTQTFWATWHPARSRTRIIPARIAVQDWLFAAIDRRRRPHGVWGCPGVRAPQVDVS